MNGRKIYWPRGRGLGGSSSINGLIYVRGQPQDYDRWADAGNAGWGWRDVLPYFIRSEGNSRGASAITAPTGRSRASDIGAKHELIEAIIAGAGDAGRAAHRRFQRRRCRKASATTSCSRATAGAAAPRSAI